uniref:G-protein coupled receptors family 1 profile domain-containing protein n=1 Tax=Plectus sambesii TaxID=2011161 RepID=A0A914UJ00_9BILA
MFGYVVPLGITCVLYYFMLRKLWYTPKPGSQTTRQPTVTNAGGSGGGGGTVSSVGKGRPENIRAKRKVTRMVMGVVIAFAVCWLPLNICFFFTGVVYPKNLVGPGGKWMVIFQIFSQVLAYTNSCLNPILYAFLSDNFRKGFVRIIGYAINKLFCGHLCKEERFKTSNRLEYTNTNNANTNTLSTRSTTAGRGSVSNRASVQMNTISQQRASSFHTISLRTSANESYALLRDRPSMTTVPERKDSKSSRKDSKSSRKDSRGSQCSEKSEDINACGPLPTFEKHRRSRLIALLELSEVDNTSSTISFDSGLCAHLD